MIQQLETTLKSGAVPQVPQFRPPSMAQPSQSSGNSILPTRETTTRASADKSKSKELLAKIEQPSKVVDNTVPPAVKPAGTQDKQSVNGVAGDPLGNARSKVQEEINNEFAAIMATGTLRASEAAALATRKVMQRYGHLKIATSQS